jgi:hypothetical protein
MGGTVFILATGTGQDLAYDDDDKKEGEGRDKE